MLWEEQRCANNGTGIVERNKEIGNLGQPLQGGVDAVQTFQARSGEYANRHQLAVSISASGVLQIMRKLRAASAKMDAM